MPGIFERQAKGETILGVPSFRLQDGDSSVLADVLDLTNTNPVATAIVDGNGDQITSFGGGTQYLDGAAEASPTGTLAMGTDGSNIYGLKTDASGELQIDVLSSALPTGASTAALQLPDGHNVTVDNASIAVTGTFFQATQPISAVALPLPTGAATSALQLPDGHNVTVDNASIAITAAALPLPTGASTSALQTTGNAILTTIDADTNAIKTSVQLLDNAVDGNYLNTNMNIAGTDVAANDGVSNAQTQRVTIASDSTGQVGLVGSFPTFGQTTTANVTATQISGTDTTIRRMTIKNLPTSNGPVYIGGSGVTVAAGYPLLPGESKTWDGSFNRNQWYFIKTSTQTTGVAYNFQT